MDRREPCLGQIAGMNLLAGALGELARQVGAPLERRPDGWPLCPLCGEDELYSTYTHHATHPGGPLTDEDKREMVLTIRGCYRCGWTPQSVGDLAESRMFWVLGEGIAHLARKPKAGDTLVKCRSVGLSTMLRWETLPPMEPLTADETIAAIARVLDRPTSDERKLATINRLVHAVRPA